MQRVVTIDRPLIAECAMVDMILGDMRNHGSWQEADPIGVSWWHTDAP